MIDRRELEKGWLYAGMIYGAQNADYIGHYYVMDVANAIDELERAINTYSGSAKANPQLGGEIAEEWVANTFNIKSIAAESTHRAFVEKSNKHASVDVSTNFGEEYSLKYLKYANQSVKAQTKNVIQNYHEYLYQAKTNMTKSPMTFEEYLSRYDYSNDMEELLMSVYKGQGRIIPSDQLEDGIRKLRQLIATESARGGDHRLANLRNYQETLQALSDRIKDTDGIESIPLSKEESHVIAELCKRGDFHPKDFGISLDSEISREYILNQALKGGTTAAVVTLAIQLVPTMLELISYLSKMKKIDPVQFKNVGLNALSVGSKGFIIGGLSCGIYTACRAGKLGVNLSHVRPGVIGTIAALTFNVMAESFQYAKGSLDTRKYRHIMTRDLMISAASITGGSISVVALPIMNALSFVIGSMVGSVIASITISAGERILLSFCEDTGFTLFGVVKQDYTLPENFFKEMGVNRIQLNRIKLNKVQPSTVSLHVASPSYIRPNLIDIQVLKRGVISFNTVGYIF